MKDKYGFPINYISNMVNGVPKEFILAVINRSETGGISINLNRNYISNQPLQQQEEIMDKYFSDYDMKSKVSFKWV